MGTNYNVPVKILLEAINKLCLVEVASLDHSNTMPQKAIHVVASALEADGVEIVNFVMSRSLICRARKQVCQLISITGKCFWLPATLLVVHFYSNLQSWIKV